MPLQRTTITRVEFVQLELPYRTPPLQIAALPPPSAGPPQRHRLSHFFSALGHKLGF
jgi:hypothetical protein